MFYYFYFIFFGGDTRVKVRGQLVGLGSPMPPCGRSFAQVPS